MCFFMCSCIAEHGPYVVSVETLHKASSNRITCMIFDCYTKWSLVININIFSPTHRLIGIFLTSCPVPISIGVVMNFFICPKQIEAFYSNNISRRCFNVLLSVKIKPLIYMELS